MKKTTSDRLKELMHTRNLRQIDILNACEPLCQKYNVKLAKNDLSQYVSGKVTPRQDKLSILAMALNVSEVWLMGYDSNTPNSLSSPAPGEEKLINIYRELNPVGQDKLMDRAEELVDLGYTQDTAGSSISRIS